MGWNGSGQNVQPTQTRRPSKRVPWGLVLGVGVAVVVGALAWWGLGPGDDDLPKKARTETDGKGRLKKNRKPGKSGKDSVREAMPETLPKRDRRRERPTRIADLFEHLKGRDRKMAEAVQTALDNDDFEKTAAAAAQALTSTNTEVRLNAVEALGWFGAQALPELMGALEDSDEEIRQSAVNHFESALQEIEKPGDQFRIAVAAFGALKSEDQLTSLGGLVSNAASELIDGEEDESKKDQNRLKVIQAVVDIIDGESSPAQAVEAAKEVYNTITGNEWLGIDEADRYLSDPDNYDPDGPTPAAGEPAQESADDAGQAAAEAPGGDAFDANN